MAFQIKYLCPKLKKHRMDLLCIVGGLFLLMLGGDALLKAAVSFSLTLRVPKMVIGMTVVSFATSAPELIVSLKSALQGHSDLALSNVIGSNIANLGLVLGLTLLLSRLKVEAAFYKKDLPILFVSSLLLYVFLIFDGILQAYEGGLLFLLLLVFLVLMFRNKASGIAHEMPEGGAVLPLHRGFLFFVLGAVGLWAGSEFLIKGAINLARDFQVSERVVGITLVSVGTSIPELFASVIAVFRGEKAISIGNLIGSNVFNILAVLGLTALFSPVRVLDVDLIEKDIYWMLLVTFLILPLSWVFSKKQFAAKEGLILLFIYLSFIIQTLV